MCIECHGTEALREELEAILGEIAVDNVQYSQWVNTDWVMLETLIVSVEDYLDQFIEVMKKLRLHDFICKKTSQICEKTKNSTCPLVNSL